MFEDRTLPPRVRGRGLVDTGTTMSLISEAIADVLSPGVIHSVELRTALGSTMAPCHAIEFQFAGPEGTQTQPIALVAARVPDLGEDMVIGLDVLRQFRFEWDGPQDALRLWPTSGRADDI